MLLQDFSSYEENPSLSCVLPILHEIIKAISYFNGDSPCIQQFKDKVSYEIKRKWSFDQENVIPILKIFNEVKESIKEQIVKLKEDSDPASNEVTIEDEHNS